jgi:GNAT superfamily N-acetyltransferase
MLSKPGFWQESWRHDVLEREFVSSGGLAFVWEEEGQLLGCVCAHDFGSRTYLGELIVKSSERRRGIGARLVERIHQEISSRGCAILISDVWHGANEIYKLLKWSGPDVKLLRKRLNREPSQPVEQRA